MGTDAFMRLPAFHDPTNPFTAPPFTPHLAPIAADGAEIALRLREENVTVSSDARICIEWFRTCGGVAERWLREESGHEVLRGHFGEVERFEERVVVQSRVVDLL